MKYTCRDCGKVIESEPSHYTTTEDLQRIFDHEKEHTKDTC